MRLCDEHCIITYMDLIDIEKMIENNSKKAVKIMQRFHEVLKVESRINLNEYEKIYVWNDSVLLLAYTDYNYSKLENIMKEADTLKRKIDSIHNCYAISVKGMTFKEPFNYQKNKNDDNKFVFLKISSFAFANCFEIEKKLSEEEISNYMWYLDERIAYRLSIKDHLDSLKVKMKPEDKEREIYMYDRYLWDLPSQVKNQE